MPVYSEEVEAAIAEVCPPRDAFDAADFDPVEYLNSRFPDEATLSALPAFVEETNNRLRHAETDLLKAVEKQATTATIAEGDLTSTKRAVEALQNRVTDIKSKASKSEDTVKELCRHIRELDIAKTNLTQSINTLRSIQLWMLQLQSLSSSFERRRYAQCRDALQEAKKYSAMFDGMKDVPKVKELNDKQTQLCRQMEYYIRNTVLGDVNVETMDENIMAEACAIIDLMDEESIKKIRDAFIEKVLETYSLRFKRGTDDATLDRTERRYVYFRNTLKTYESVFTNVFPRHWCVPQELCVSFCLRTKVELDYQLRDAIANNRMNLTVLNYTLKKTIEMERELTQAMAWKEEFPGRDRLPVYRYSGLILSAFKEHMGLLVENEDQMMQDALSHPLIGEGDNVCPGWNGEEDVIAGVSLPMAEDLFVFIKVSLKRTLQMAQQDVLVEMAGVWRRHLLRFSASVAKLLPAPAVSALEVRRACILVNTADLCQSTSTSLGSEICAKSEVPPKEVGFDTVVDSFSTLFTASVVAIVQGLDRSLQPLLVEYANGGFYTAKTGGAEAGGNGTQDESRLIRSMTTILHDMILQCAAVLPINTLRFLLDKVAASVIPRYANTLYRTRAMPIEAVNAMRMDASVLEKTLLQLPNYNDPNRYPPAMLTGYMRLVRREFDVLQRALKVLQVDPRSQGFLDIYYELVLPEDRSIQNFVRLVELKGLRREEVRPWIASLSKRGVVEATKRDLDREAAAGLATGASAPATSTVAAAANTGGGGINFAALFSRDANMPAAPSTQSSGGGGGAAFFSSLIGGGSTTGGATAAPATSTAAAAANASNTPEKEGGHRFGFSSAATSMGFLSKFKSREKSEK